MKKKKADSQREQISDYPWGEARKEGQVRGWGSWCGECYYVII